MTDAMRRRIKVTDLDTVEIVEEPGIAPSAGEALVSMQVAGVCGSDTHAVHGLHPQMKIPYYPGHEVVGEVLAVGEGVDTALLGRRVTPEPTLPCGACKACSNGDENVCENLQFFGCGYREGGMADSWTIPASRLRFVPDDFTLGEAALIEPLATPVHAARLAGDLTGSAVLIQGAGTIGRLMLAAARHAGARRIVVSDVLEAKRQAAMDEGADAVLDPKQPGFEESVLHALGETADFVFDCVSIQSTVDAGIKVLAKAGVFVTVGVPQAPVTVDLPTVQDRQQRIIGVATYLKEDYDTATRMIAAGDVKESSFITATFPFAEAAAAFADATTGEQTKVLITME